MFDTKCAELAVHFLGTDVSDANVASLAQAIQNAVEDWMEGCEPVVERCAECGVAPPRHVFECSKHVD